MAQCQDSMTESDIRPCCWWPCVPVGQHYDVAMSAHCHQSVPILKAPWILLECKTTATKERKTWTWGDATWTDIMIILSQINIQMFNKLYIYNKTSQNRPTMGPNFKWSISGGGKFKEIEYRYKWHCMVNGFRIQIKQLIHVSCVEEVSVEEVSSSGFLYIRITPCCARACATLLSV